MLDSICRLALVGTLVFLIAGCSKADPVQNQVSPNVTGDATAELALKLKAEGQAKDLGFCLAALQMEYQKASEIKNSSAQSLQQRLQQVSARADAIQAASDNVRQAFQTQFETLTRMMKSSAMCGNLKCSDASFRQSVISESCPNS